MQTACSSELSFLHGLAFLPAGAELPLLAVDTSASIDWQRAPPSRIPHPSRAANDVGDERPSVLSIVIPPVETVGVVNVVRVLPVDILGAARSVRSEHGPILVGCAKHVVRTIAPTVVPPHGNRPRGHGTPSIFEMTGVRRIGRAKNPWG
jgi:hypothetical protein